MSETYFKKAEDLSKRELLLIYDSLEDRKFPSEFPITEKRSIVCNILKINTNALVNDGKYVFRKDENGIVKYLPNNQDCVNQKYARPHHKINLNKIKTLMNAETLEEHLMTSDIDDSDVDDDNTDNINLDETVRQTLL